MDEKISGFLFGDIANRTLAGRALTFVIAAVVVLAWAVTGPYFNYSDTWQLVINGGTTIVTFLMVFLIRNSQNRDSAAIQVKSERTYSREHGSQLVRRYRNLTDEEIEELRTNKKSVERNQQEGTPVRAAVDKNWNLPD